MDPYKETAMKVNFWHPSNYCPASKYMLSFNNRNTRNRFEICSKLTIKHQNDVNDIVLVFLLLTLNTFRFFLSVSIVDFEQVNVSWLGLYQTSMMELFSKIFNGSKYLVTLKIKQQNCIFVGYKCLQVFQKNLGLGKIM